MKDRSIISRIPDVAGHRHHGMKRSEYDVGLLQG